MNVRDVMRMKVISISPDMPTPDIARLLLENHIGAGGPIGMMREGDLIRCDDAECDERRDGGRRIDA